jgi:hypothetical protein
MKAKYTLKVTEEKSMWKTSDDRDAFWHNMAGKHSAVWKPMVMQVNDPAHCGEILTYEWVFTKLDDYLLVRLWLTTINVAVNVVEL